MSESPYTFDTRYTTTDRNTAASLLRSARRDGGEAIDWAHAALPDHRLVARLKIRQLMDDGHHDAAEALLNRELLKRPQDAHLGRQRAVCLLERGETYRADAEIRRLLERDRSEHRTLLLAARIARARGDLTAAVALLADADRLHPCEEIKRTLVETLLEAGIIDHARETLEAMARPSITLEARILEAEGRIRDALDVLEERTPDDEEALCEQIAILERTGARSELEALLENIPAKMTRAHVRAGRAWLSLGFFERAAREMMAIEPGAPSEREARGLETVAAALSGRTAQAERALTRLASMSHGVDPQLLADLWNRGLAARTIAEAWTPPTALDRRTDDPARTATTPLAVLVEDAIDTLTSAASRASHPDRREELTRLRGLCLAAAGSPIAAAQPLTPSETLCLPTI